MNDRHDKSILRHIVQGVALTEFGAAESAGRAHEHPLVFVHGGCHGAWQWEGMQGWFADRGWNSLALDWLGHGASESLPEEEFLKRSISAVPHEIGIACAAALEKWGAAPVVVGHSMGGCASLAYAVRATGAESGGADEPAALVLLAPVVPRAFGGAPIDLPVDFDVPWGPPPPEISRHLFYSAADDATAAAYHAKLRPESPQAVWEATRWGVDLDVSGLRTPTLVVAAEDDVLVPAAYDLALAEEIGAESILLPGVGHGGTLDPDWPALAERIESWLEGVTA